MPNSRSGPGAPPKGIGFFSRPVVTIGSSVGVGTCAVLGAGASAAPRGGSLLGRGARGGGIDGALLGGWNVGAGKHGHLARAAGLAFDAAEAVVGERQAELGVVRRAAHIGALGGGREFDEGDPGKGDDEHRQARDRQL